MLPCSFLSPCDCSVLVPGRLNRPVWSKSPRIPWLSPFRVMAGTVPLMGLSSVYRVACFAVDCKFSSFVGTFSLTLFLFMYLILNA